MPLLGVSSTAETGKPVVIGDPRVLEEYNKSVQQTETVETKVWGGNDGKAGISVGHTIVSNVLSREEMAAISRRFVVEHYRLTFAELFGGSNGHQA